jgi:hypothetical protein
MTGRSLPVGLWSADDRASRVEERGAVVTPPPPPADANADDADDVEAFDSIDEWDSSEDYADVSTLDPSSGTMIEEPAPMLTRTGLRALWTISHTLHDDGGDAGRGLVQTALTAENE